MQEIHQKSRNLIRLDTLTYQTKAVSKELDGLVKPSSPLPPSLFLGKKNYECSAPCWFSARGEWEADVQRTSKWEAKPQTGQMSLCKVQMALGQCEGWRANPVWSKICI